MLGFLLVGVGAWLALQTPGFVPVLGWDFSSKPVDAAGSVLPYSGCH